MKIQFSALTAAALVLLLSTACQREELANGIFPGEEVNVTISAVMPSGGPEVKSAEDPGDGSAINRCVLGVYLVNGSTQELYGDVMYEAVSGGTATFEDVALLTGYDYKLVFWADNVAETSALSTDNHYTVTFETIAAQVSYKSEGTYTSSDDTRDAFFGVFDLEGFSGTVEDSYTLTRPFGQLNIFTTDYAGIRSDALKPAKVQIIFPSIPTGMNLLTGATTSSTAVTGTVSSIPTLITSPVVSGAQQLSFDYIFAPADQQLMLQNIEMAFYDASGSPLSIESYTFPELPVQRNYRTNVSGALLTDRAGLSIEVKPDFDETVTVAEQAETIEAAQLAINAGMTDIEFTKAVNGTITLPEGNKNYRIAFNEGTDGAVTIKGSDFTGNVEVENNGSSSNALAISLTYGSAEVKSGTWGNIDVKTGTGFVLGEKAEGKILSTNRGKGDIEIYGKISTFSPDFMWSGTVTVFTVYGEEACKDAFASFVNDDCEKVVLGNDISITPPNTYQITGSGSHVIDLAGSKLAIKDFNANVMNVSDGAALTIQNGVISNDFTLGTNEVTIAAFVTGNHGSIEIEKVEFTTVATGAMIKEGAQQANLTIRNSTIRSTKNGYAVGTNASSSTSDVVVTLENSTLKSDYGCAVLFNIDGKINVSGSDIIGGNQGLILRGGTGILSDSDVSLNCIEQNASQYANFMHNSDWASGSNVPFAAITAGNRGAGYEYPTTLTLENCEVKSIGENAGMFPAMYVWGNSADNNVTITHTNTTFVEKVIYGDNGANITVNGQQASQLTE